MPQQCLKSPSYLPGRGNLGNGFLASMWLENEGLYLYVVKLSVLSLVTSSKPVGAT